jgi:hypothetical protein
VSVIRTVSRPGDTCRHTRHTRSCTPSTPPLASALDRNLPTGPARSSVGHRPRFAQRCRPADTCRHTRHNRSWHAVRVILTVSAQPTLADRPCTILTGAPFALCSALPPSRHLPTRLAHSFLTRGPRHPHRLRPADTCRHARHTRSRHVLRVILTVSAQPTPADTLGTLLRLMAIIPPSVPSAINRTVSPAVDKSGEAVASATARNPSDGLASCGEIRRASRPYSAIHRMVSPAVEKSVEEVSSRAIRNPLHGLARGDCRRCADDRRRAYVMDNHGGLTPPLLCGTNANLEVVCRKCRRCHRAERRPW